MTWLRLVPTWCWWLLAVAAVAAGQQIRVSSLQGELYTERAASTEQYGKLVACRETRGNLLVQVGEQNSALADLRAKAAARAQQAEQAQAGARQQSEVDYQAANRLQLERIGGDACAAATSVIDKELGL
ncbi:hypothetical protein [Phytopseudomonas seleniipraecipitans]|uniref:Uncharacterized protein n=1 Tax=Phytopseudomonas seleniipraecipitans TaxID=640205 RepID=A0A1G7JC38_9GAMM|nr:hypothetical protein [Pseudomonas seleniipraecipitans]SDF22039.1 hypothetical protein SAMN05216381_1050 [Pseudomonas seleniipraecipitans]